ncbi:hypothetical protein ABIC65_003352 [Sphingomonas trueperi]|uniref:hypothetical protein n=1 Tax=Sphingomonas trueperi TaxID=53317 RepID=UPI0033985E09
MKIMLPTERRARLTELVRQRKACRRELSRFMGRGAGHLSNYLTPSVPYDPAERDRERLARYFGVDKETPRPTVPKLRHRPGYRARVFVTSIS